ncbi:hypothetical protein AHAS_Ahas15G0093300 [Arachis hypogaea]
MVEEIVARLVKFLSSSFRSLSRLEKSRLVLEDTLAIVKLPRKQAEAISASTYDVLNDNIDSRALSSLSLWLIALARKLSPSLVSGLPHCLRTGTQARRRSLGSGLSHSLWSPTQSRSLAFPAVVVADSRSSRSWDWSSSSLPVSSPSCSQSRTFVALVAGSRSSRSQGFLLAVSNSRCQLPSRNQKLVPIW